MLVVEGKRVGRGYPLVAASVGPFGATLDDGSEYRGSYGLSVGQLIDFHRERLACLIAAGADLLACEALPCADWWAAAAAPRRRPSHLLPRCAPN